MQTFMTNQAKETSELRESIKQMQVHNKVLETQLAQMAGSMKSAPTTQPLSQGVNPNEQAHAIITRSGRQLENVCVNGGTAKKDDKQLTNDLIDDGIEKDNDPPTQPPKAKDDELVTNTPPSYVAKLPYPSRFATSKLDDQFAKFLEVLKKIHVNIPFTEALKQMPTYAKFLKEILSKKRAVDSVDTINLTESCSAIIQNKMPTKLKDPGSFDIPCAIGDMTIDRVLCDLGASVSLMPHSVCNLGELKPTHI